MLELLGIGGLVLLTSRMVWMYFSNRGNAFIGKIFVIMGLFCVYFLWSIAYMAQMNPRIVPSI